MLVFYCENKSYSHWDQEKSQRWSMSALLFNTVMDGWINQWVLTRQFMKQKLETVSICRWYDRNS